MYQSISLHAQKMAWTIRQRDKEPHGQMLNFPFSDSTLFEYNSKDHQLLQPTALYTRFESKKLSLAIWHQCSG